MYEYPNYSYTFNKRGNRLKFRRNTKYMNNKNSGETENKKEKIEVLPSQNESTESSNCENSINEKENIENKKAREKVSAEERKQFVNQWIE